MSDLVIAKRIALLKENESIDEKRLQELLNYTGKNTNELIQALITIFLMEKFGNDTLNYKIKMFENEVKALEVVISNLKNQYGLNGNVIQTSKVASGVKIAKKHEQIGEIRRMKEAGLSDNKIMERLQISRSTLWRLKSSKL